MAAMTDAQRPQGPTSSLPEDAIIVPTEGATPEQLDKIAAEMSAALLPKINAWRVKNGYPPLTD